MKKQQLPEVEPTLKGILAEQATLASVGQKICYQCKLPLCNVCVVCHTPECAFFALKVATVEETLKHKVLLCRTQKVRGFVTLERKAKLKIPAPYWVVMEESDIDQCVASALAKNISTLFVRPCPIRARHGFEESRRVEWAPDTGAEGMAAEIKKIFAASNAADEEHAAELILLPYIDAKFNSIITPTRIAVGPNNDGATAGYESIQIPLMNVPFKEVASGIFDAAGLSADEDPYVEVVSTEALMEPVFTQIRAGVRIPSSIGSDYVPATMRVLEVIDADGDLLEWEKQVKAIKPGTVVVKLGGTLISHYGVHCLYNKVPCFTSRRPALGELLDPIGKSPKPDVAAIQQGLADGALFGLNHSSSGRYGSVGDKLMNIDCALVAMMTILHNAGAMSGKDSYWLGVAVSIMMRAGMAASHGEARHKLDNMQAQRNYVYKLALSDFLDARKTLGTAQWMFENLKWSSSYGGKAWAKCTQSIIDLDEAVCNFLKSPEESTVAPLVSKLNEAVNQAHNGGWWLNKFILQHWFNKASAQSLETLAIAAHSMFAMQKLKPSTDAADELITVWRAANPIEVVPGKKLLIQEKKPDVDQTVFTLGEKTKIEAEAKTSDPESEYVLMPKSDLPFSITDTEYTGPMCTGCGTMFPDLEDVFSCPPLKCTEVLEGRAICGSIIGNYDGSTIAFYKLLEGNSPEPVTEAKPGFTISSLPLEYLEGPSLKFISWDTETSETAKIEAITEHPPINIPLGGKINPGVTSTPQIKYQKACPSYHNVNPYKSSAGVVTKAQCNFEVGEGSTICHIQFQTKDISPIEYFSFNIILLGIDEQRITKIKQGQTNPMITWSGSGVYNYWPMEILNNDKPPLVQTEIKGLGITITFNSETKLIASVEYSKEDLSGEKQEEQQEVWDDIPF